MSAPKDPTTQVIKRNLEQKKLRYWRQCSNKRTNTMFLAISKSAHSVQERTRSTRHSTKVCRQKSLSKTKHKTILLTLNLLAGNLRMLLSSNQDPLVSQLRRDSTPHDRTKLPKKSVRETLERIQRTERMLKHQPLPLWNNRTTLQLVLGRSRTFLTLLSLHRPSVTPN